jgi:hypothetical protein
VQGSPPLAWSDWSATPGSLFLPRLSTSLWTTSGTSSRGTWPASMVHAVLPALPRTRGRVVVVGSVGDRIATPMLGAYDASKFSLLGLTDSLRAELAPFGIRVDSIFAMTVDAAAVAAARWTIAGRPHHPPSPPPPSPIELLPCERSKRGCS